MQYVAEKLRQHSLKATPQRIAIYDYLSQSLEHPSAERIFEELGADFPAMSLSTVYKALDAFKSHNLAVELNAGEEHFRYDANVAPHGHFYCLRCLSLADVPCEGATKIPGALENCRVLYERSYFFGYCPECLAKTQAEG